MEYNFFTCFTNQPCSRFPKLKLHCAKPWTEINTKTEKFSLSNLKPLQCSKLKLFPNCPKLSKMLGNLSQD